jgi:hypothetical protein
MKTHPELEKMLGWLVRAVVDCARAVAFALQSAECSELV